MCGRYTLTTDARTLSKQFDAEVGVDLFRRYNIAPTQPVAVVRRPMDAVTRRIDLLHWGLVPHWAKDPTLGNRLINARAETVASKPSYRAAFRHRRCLVPADGFIEWRKLPSGRKQPHLIFMADEHPFAMAGLWEHWQDAHGNELESVAIITTEPNEMMAQIHNRMPVILDPDDYDTWLDPEPSSAENLHTLLRTLPAELMAHHPVSTRVNNPKHEDPQCIESVLAS